MMHIALVSVVGGAAHGPLDAIGQPCAQVRLKREGGGGGEDASASVGHNRVKFGPTLGLGLGANPTPLAVRSKERASIADDLALLIATRRNRSCAVSPTSLLRHPSTPFTFPLRLAS